MHRLIKLLFTSHMTAERTELVGSRHLASFFFDDCAKSELLDANINELFVRRKDGLTPFHLLCSNLQNYGGLLKYVAESPVINDKLLKEAFNSPLKPIIYRKTLCPVELEPINSLDGVMYITIDGRIGFFSSLEIAIKAMNHGADIVPICPVSRSVVEKIIPLMYLSDHQLALITNPEDPEELLDLAGRLLDLKKISEGSISSETSLEFADVASTVPMSIDSTAISDQSMVKELEDTGSNASFATTAQVSDATPTLNRSFSMSQPSDEIHANTRKSLINQEVYEQIRFQVLHDFPCTFTKSKRYLRVFLEDTTHIAKLTEGATPFKILLHFKLTVELKHFCSTKRFLVDETVIEELTKNIIHPQALAFKESVAVISILILALDPKGIEELHRRLDVLVKIFPMGMIQFFQSFSNSPEGITLLSAVFNHRSSIEFFKQVNFSILDKKQSTALLKKGKYATILDELLCHQEGRDLVASILCRNRKRILKEFLDEVSKDVRYSPYASQQRISLLFTILSPYEELACEIDSIIDTVMPKMSLGHLMAKENADSNVTIWERLASHQSGRDLLVTIMINKPEFFAKINPLYLGMFFYVFCSTEHNIAILRDLIVIDKSLLQIFNIEFLTRRLNDNTSWFERLIVFPAGVDLLKEIFVTEPEYLLNLNISFLTNINSNIFSRNPCSLLYILSQPRYIDLLEEVLKANNYKILQQLPLNVWFETGELGKTRDRIIQYSKILPTKLNNNCSALLTAVVKYTQALSTSVTLLQRPLIRSREEIIDFDMSPPGSKRHAGLR